MDGTHPGWPSQQPHLPARLSYFNPRLFVYAAIFGGAWGTLLGLAIDPLRDKHPLWSGHELYIALGWSLWYASVNVLTFLAYGYDKLAAVFRWGRIRENSLIWWTALGAIPGDAVARSVWNHKHHDEAFMYRVEFVSAAAWVPFGVAFLWFGWRGVLGAIERLAW